MTNRFVLYARISSTKQEGNTSIESQLQEMRDYCRRNDLEIIAELYETKSGTGSEERHAFHRCLSLLDKGMADGLMVTDIDRFFRNAWQGLECYEKNFQRLDKRFISLRQNFDASLPEGYLVFGTFLLFSEYSNKQHQARMRKGADAAKARGQKGSGPLGYAQSVGPDGELLIDFDSPGYKIVARCMAKGYGICRTTNELQWAEVYNDSGKPFSKSSVIGMIAKLAQKEEENGD